MSIRMKVVIGVVVVFVIGALAVVGFMRQAFENNVQRAALAAVGRDRAVFSQLQADDTAKLSATALALAQDESYRSAFADRDREALLARSTPVFEQLKKDFSITHWYFETPKDEGSVFLRVHKPAQFGDVLKRKTYLQAAETGEPAAGLELGATAVALRVVRPYYAADGTSLIGYLELGQEIDEFLTEIKSQTGDDVGLLLTKESMNATGWAALRETAGLENNWDAQPDYVLAGATGAGDSMTYTGSAEDVPEAGEVIGMTEGEEGTDVQGVFPVKDAGGTTIGLVFVQHDITATAASLEASMHKVLLAVLVMMSIVLVLVIVFMNTLVFGRLNRMIQSMEDISLRMVGGDFDVVYAHSGRKDEIGRFEAFFADFIAMTASAIKDLLARRAS